MAGRRRDRHKASREDEENPVHPPQGRRSTASQSFDSNEADGRKVQGWNPISTYRLLDDAVHSAFRAKTALDGHYHVLPEERRRGESESRAAELAWRGVPAQVCVRRGIPRSARVASSKIPTACKIEAKDVQSKAKGKMQETDGDFPTRKSARVMDINNDVLSLNFMPAARPGIINIFAKLFVGLAALTERLWQCTWSQHFP